MIFPFIRWNMYPFPGGCIAFVKIWSFEVSPRQETVYSTLLYYYLRYSTLLSSTLLYSTIIYPTLLYSTLLFSLISKTSPTQKLFIQTSFDKCNLENMYVDKYHTNAFGSCPNPPKVTSHESSRKLICSRFGVRQNQHTAYVVHCKYA